VSLAAVILAFREASDLARFAAAWHGGAPSNALTRWRRREDGWVRGKETMLLKPRHFLSSLGTREGWPPMRKAAGAAPGRRTPSARRDLFARLRAAEYFGASPRQSTVRPNIRLE